MSLSDCQTAHKINFVLHFQGDEIHSAVVPDLWSCNTTVIVVIAAFVLYLIALNISYWDHLLALHD